MTEAPYAVRQARARRDRRPLTRLEWAALCLWVSGATYQQIALSLNQRPGTAHSTIRRLSWKLGVEGVIEAAKLFPSVPRPTPADTPDMECGA